MNELSQAAMAAIDEVWGSVAHEERERPEPAYAASLWRMAGHICTAYALQHRTIDDGLSATFAWLASIAEQRQLMALHPEPAQRPVKLAVVGALHDMHRERAR